MKVSSLNQPAPARTLITVLKLVIGAVICIAIGATASLIYHLNIAPQSNEAGASTTE